MPATDPQPRHKAPAPQDARVLSYLAVRRALGILGLALPAALLIYALPLRFGMQPSISEFYHSHMGDFVVGCLVAIGVFLISYQGYPRQPGERLSDQWVSTVAGIGALGVALLPASPPHPAACPPGSVFAVVVDPAREVICPIQGIFTHWAAYEWVHFAFAAVFFACLAIFCFFLFPAGDRKPDGRIDWSTGRNRVYLICGFAILGSVLAIGGYALSGDGTKEWLRGYNYVFWAEAVGVVAFAISWLTKGKIVQGVTNMMS